MGYAAPYYLRLRIYSRHAAYFYYKLRGLEPVYDNCPVRCLAPEKDRENGCPDCSYTIHYNEFRANYYKILVKQLKEGGFTGNYSEAADDWSFEDLQADYRVLSELEELAGVETEETPGRISPEWNIRTLTAIRIIREERYKVRREKSYERELEEEAKRRSARARGKG